MTVSGFIPYNPNQYQLAPSTRLGRANAGVTSSNVTADHATVNELAEFLPTYIVRGQNTSSMESNGELPAYENTPKADSLINGLYQGLRANHVGSKVILVLALIGVAFSIHLGLGALLNATGSTVSSVSNPSFQSASIEHMFQLSMSSPIGGSNVNDLQYLDHLHEQYLNRSAKHKDFMDHNTVALIDEMSNVVVAVTDSAVFTLSEFHNLTTELNTATKNSEKLEIMQKLILKLSVNRNNWVLVKMDGIHANIEALVTRFIVINKELDDFEAFLENIGREIRKIPSWKTNAKKVFGPERPYSPAPLAAPGAETMEMAVGDLHSTIQTSAWNGTVEDLEKLQAALAQAALEKHIPSIIPPARYLDSTADGPILHYNLTMVLAAKLSPALQDHLMICDATIHATWVPITVGYIKGEDPVAETACKLFTFSLAKADDLGVEDGGWVWYDEDHAKGGKTAIFGERAVQKVNWWTA